MRPTKMNKMLITTAALLCVLAVPSAETLAVAESQSVFGPHGGQGPTGPHYHGPHYTPFCYCRRGFVLRSYGSWPYCRCYKFVRDIASWAEAKEYCGVMRANMMEVKDPSTQSWLQNQLFRRRNSFSHHLLERAEYWLGATDLEEEGKWRWRYTDVGRKFWLPREPNNYLSYQNCMAIKERSLNSRRYGWFDDDCYEKKFYICERQGWYCWGSSCWRTFAKLPKRNIPKDTARARRGEPSVAQPAAPPAQEKVVFED